MESCEGKSMVRGGDNLSHSKLIVGVNTDIPSNPLTTAILTPHKKPKDAWNLGKLKILKTLSHLGDSNALRIAKRTRKSVGATDHILKRLLKYKHIKIIHHIKNNDGCCNRFALTPKGEEYLRILQTQFLQGNDLNLKFEFPVKVNYKEVDKEFRRREFPPHSLEPTGELREFKISRTTTDSIFIGDTKDIQLFTTESKPYAAGDFFNIFNRKYIIYYIEKFTLPEYAATFAQYNTPKDPAAYAQKLQNKHPGAVFIYLLYFKRHNEEQKTTASSSPSQDKKNVYEEKQKAAGTQAQEVTPAGSMLLNSPKAIPLTPVYAAKGIEIYCAIGHKKMICPDPACSLYRDCHQHSHVYAAKPKATGTQEQPCK